MSAGYQAKHPRGSRKNNVGDENAVPLLSARALWLAKDDAVNGHRLRSVSEYYRLSVNWFHIGVTGSPLRFVHLKDGTPNTETGRATTFRKWTGEDLDKFVCLSVAGNNSAAKQFTAAVRADAESHLVDYLFESIPTADRYRSVDYVRAYFFRLQSDKSFAGLMADAGFVTFCSQFNGHKHEARLIEFAKLTLGLCS